MVNIIDESIRVFKRRENHEKLSEIIAGETKNIDVKRHDLSLGHIAVYRPGIIGLLGYSKKRDIMRIIDCDICFSIDLKDNHYMDLAKNIGERIEKEYKTKVNIHHKS